jgi:hypothetical protein
MCIVYRQSQSKEDDSDLHLIISGEITQEMIYVRYLSYSCMKQVKEQQPIVQNWKAKSNVSDWFLQVK